MAELLRADAMQVRESEAVHQGYNTPADAKRAARRAVRAVSKAARDGGKRPPTHLQRKVALLVPLVKTKEKQDG
jgi:predicted RNA-binding protein associated with RNAse of E/G family